MASVPGEVLEDVLQPLDRWTLDAVQFTNRRFLRLIAERMKEVCLRQLSYAHAVFNTSNEDAECNSYVRINDGPKRRNISNAHKDPVHLLSAFLKALRSSRVEALTFSGLTFTPAIATLLLESPITAHQLSFLTGSCTELTSTQFRDVVLHLSPTSLCLYSCLLRACQINDEFLCSLPKNHVRRASFQNLVPVDGDSFCVTDDAVVDFCMQQDVCVGEEEDAPKPGPVGELVLHNGSFTKCDKSR
ncbi:hypothetical protein AAVH_17913 [Aphelenchoides avenae]|nr:hypothetical protein AAVH_17913 [Aphelenchus avenae]